MNIDDFWCRAFLVTMAESYRELLPGTSRENHDWAAAYSERAADSALEVAKRRGMIAGALPGDDVPADPPRPAPTLERVEFTAERDQGWWIIGVHNVGVFRVEPQEQRSSMTTGNAIRVKWGEMSPPKPIEVWLERPAPASAAPAAEPDVLRWLAAQENPQSWGPRFGVWRPSSGAYQERRFHARRVEWALGSLHLFGDEGGPEVSFPVRQIMRGWTRVDAPAENAPVEPVSTSPASPGMSDAEVAAEFHRRFRPIRVRIGAVDDLHTSFAEVDVSNWTSGGRRAPIVDHPAGEPGFVAAVLRARELVNGGGS